MLERYLKKGLIESANNQSCFTLRFYNIKYRIEKGKISFIIGNNIFISNKLLLDDLSTRLCQER